MRMRQDKTRGKDRPEEDEAGQDKMKAVEHRGKRDKTGQEMRRYEGTIAYVSEVNNYLRIW